MLVFVACNCGHLCQVRATGVSATSDVFKYLVQADIALGSITFGVDYLNGKKLEVSPK